MKRLILINGTMGVGKTAVCRELLPLLQPGVFLDGDWCWNMEPFQVTEETRQMVMENCAFLLRQFLHCSAYETILFGWVMHLESIQRDLLSRLLPGGDWELYLFTLRASDSVLQKRLEQDVQAGLRKRDVIRRSLERQELYASMRTVPVQTDGMSPAEAAGWIEDYIRKRPGVKLEDWLKGTFSAVDPQI